MAGSGDAYGGAVSVCALGDVRSGQIWSVGSLDPRVSGGLGGVARPLDWSFVRWAAARFSYASFRETNAFLPYEGLQA